MAMKAMYAGALFLCGWMWFYMFLRQLLFNFLTAFPLIRQMNEVSAGLIDSNSKRYTWVSVAVCVLVSAIVAAIVIIFCKLYLLISFFAGGLLAFILYFKKLMPADRSSFDTFCGAYYRFVTDDELRTAMYNKKPSQMKVRLHAMELSTSFIPEFKD